MTQDEIIEMAKQAGAIPIHKNLKNNALVNNKDIIAFANLIAKHEREACAKICDRWAVGYPHPSTTIAATIRTRDQE